ncbi:hypothetical protein GGR56DRAFT_674698 [Xylariaceae sp. FL0804]|nr:hypothetical protein GGR56DRAFT_674698 [Xylariaceae sp. FL0804]
MESQNNSEVDIQRATTVWERLLIQLDGPQSMLRMHVAEYLPKKKGPAKNAAQKRRGRKSAVRGQSQKDTAEAQAQPPDPALLPTSDELYEDLLRSTGLDDDSSGERNAADENGADTGVEGLLGPADPDYSGERNAADDYSGERNAADENGADTGVEGILDPADPEPLGLGSGVDTWMGYNPASPYQYPEPNQDSSAYYK